jgi:hypothetical protein
VILWTQGIETGIPNEMNNDANHFIRA